MPRNLVFRLNHKIKKIREIKMPQKFHVANILDLKYAPLKKLSRNKLKF